MNTLSFPKNLENDEQIKPKQLEGKIQQKTRIEINKMENK